MQMKGFSPKWISMCVLKLLVSEQEKFHCVHLKGFLAALAALYLTLVSQSVTDSVGATLEF